MKRSTKALLTTVAGLALAAAPIALPGASAQDMGQQDIGQNVSDAVEVKTAQDGEWIGITGEVQAVSGELFELDYGADTITVEMDDHDWYNDNVVVPGDQVTVTGRVDHDFYETRKIEASTVYIASLNEYFYASAADEEGGYFAYPAAQHSGQDSWTSLTGRVQNIDNDMFILDTGVQAFEIDTGPLPYDPFDGEGRELEAGDRVVVSGIVDDEDLFEDSHIEAMAITTLTSAW